jgi:hypothetical protein
MGKPTFDNGTPRACAAGCTNLAARGSRDARELRAADAARGFGLPLSKEGMKLPNKIGGFKQTRGTETSQYPEERTSTETPLVVASERGPGQ